MTSKGYWYRFCMNEGEGVIEFINENTNKIYLSLERNKRAIDLIEDLFDHDDIISIEFNEAIFVYDNYKMSKNCNIFKEELIAYVYHPDRLFRNVSGETDLDETFSHLMN